jgi:protein TonB
MNTVLTHEEHVKILCAGLAGLRVLAVAPAAVVATLVLLWGMERLIRADGNLQVPEMEVYHVPDPVLIEPPPPQVLYDRPKPPELVEIEPKMPELAMDIEAEEGSFMPPAAIPPSNVPPTITGVAGDTPVATMLIQPAYPAVAASRGLEGFVDVEFDVTETGATTNVRILQAQPAKVFERETIKAVKRWKFSPVIRDGQPVAYFGMVQRVHFQMEKG